MKNHNNRHASYGWTRHRARASTTPSPPMTILRALALFCVLAGFAGVIGFGLTLALDEMTRRDCLHGVAAACQELNR